MLYYCNTREKMEPWSTEVQIPAGSPATSSLQLPLERKESINFSGTDLFICKEKKPFMKMFYL